MLLKNQTMTASKKLKTATNAIRLAVILAIIIVELHAAIF